MHRKSLSPLAAMPAAILTAALLPLSLLAQSTAPLPSPGLRFLDVFDGGLLTGGQSVHVSLNRPLMSSRIRGVEFLFVPDGGGRPVSVGTDLIGTTPTQGPDCYAGCSQDGVYMVRLGTSLSSVPPGWGHLRARALGAGDQTVNDATAHMFLHFAPIKAAFLQPSFMQVLPANGIFPVVAATRASNIKSVFVTWVAAEVGDRNVNPFEQHAVGFNLTPGGHASCVPTAVGANLAWLNDTLQWFTRPGVCANVNQDVCLVNALGFGMGTNSKGTTGPGGDVGLVSVLAGDGYIQNVDYNLEHYYAPQTPEDLFKRYQAGDMVSVGLHNLPNENSFGHFLALDNVAMQANGTALVRLMDPHTIDQNPAQTGEYRWFTMYPDGTLAWSAAPGTGYYTPASGLVVLDEVQIVSGFHFFGNNPGGNAPEPIASASTVPATRKGGTVPGELRGQTWVGMFVPPPDPDVSGWLLISEVTLQTGHKQRDFQFVTRTALTGGR